MASKETKKAFYPIKSVYLALFIVGIVIIGAVTLAAKLKVDKVSVYKNLPVLNPLNEQRNTNSFSSFLNVPDGWEIKVNDESNCYSILIIKRGKYDGDLKKYIKWEVYKGAGPSEITDLNTYETNSPQVVDVGVGGMLNMNVLYVKDSNNNIYVLEVDSTPKGDEAHDKGLEVCGDLKPVVQHIVKNLL